jgi:hypothetical protein
MMVVTLINYFLAGGPEDYAWVPDHVGALLMDQSYRKGHMTEDRICRALEIRQLLSDSVNGNPDRIVEVGFMVMDEYVGLNMDGFAKWLTEYVEFYIGTEPSADITVDPRQVGRREAERIAFVGMPRVVIRRSDIQRGHHLLRAPLQSLRDRHAAEGFTFYRVGSEDALLADDAQASRPRILVGIELDQIVDPISFVPQCVAGGKHEPTDAESAILAARIEDYFAAEERSPVRRAIVDDLVNDLRGFGK